MTRQFILGQSTIRRRTLVFTFLWLSLHAFVLARVTTASTATAQSLPWMNPSSPPAQRAELLVEAMTLDQKIQQLHGQPGNIPELPECGRGGRHVPGIPG